MSRKENNSHLNQALDRYREHFGNKPERKLYEFNDFELAAVALLAIAGNPELLETGNSQSLVDYFSYIKAEIMAASLNGDKADASKAENLKDRLTTSNEKEQFDRTLSKLTRKRELSKAGLLWAYRRHYPELLAERMLVDRNNNQRLWLVQPAEAGESDVRLRRLDYLNGIKLRQNIATEMLFQEQESIIFHWYQLDKPKVEERHLEQKTGYKLLEYGQKMLKKAGDKIKTIFGARPRWPQPAATPLNPVTFSGR